jgi:hypothetical protein
MQPIHPTHQQFNFVRAQSATHKTLHHLNTINLRLTSTLTPIRIIHIAHNLALHLQQRQRPKAHHAPVHRARGKENRRVRGERLGDLAPRAREDDRVRGSEVSFFCERVARADGRAVVLAPRGVGAFSGGLFALEVLLEEGFGAVVANGAA